MVRTLREYLEYRDGKLYWKQKPCKKVVVGKVAGSKCAGEYLAVKLFKQRYLVHHIVWWLHGNTIPEGKYLDHINRDKLDNRIENLRLACPTENTVNSSRYGNRNCYWNERVQAYQVRVQFRGKHYHAGKYFKSLQAARKAAQQLRDEIHGEFSVNIT